MAKKFAAFVELRGSDLASGVIGRGFSKIVMGGQAAAKTWSNISGRFRSSINGITTALGAMGVGLGAREAWGVLKGYGDRGDELLAFSRQTRVGVEALQEYDHAAEIANVGTETWRQSLGIFVRTLGQARAGGGTLTAWAKTHDRALVPLIKREKGTGVVLDAIFDRMARMPRVTDRAAFAQAAFGRAGMRMVRFVAEGADGLREMREEARRYGLITEQDAKAAGVFGDALDRIKAAGRGVINTFGRYALPIATDQMQRVTDWIQQNRGKLADWISQGFDKVERGLRWVAAHWESIVKTAKTFARLWVVGKAGGVMFDMAKLSVSLAMLKNMGTGAGGGSLIGTAAQTAGSAAGGAIAGKAVGGGAGSSFGEGVKRVLLAAAGPVGVAIAAALLATLIPRTAGGQENSEEWERTRGKSMDWERRKRERERWEKESGGLLPIGETGAPRRNFGTGDIAKDQRLLDRESGPNSTRAELAEYARELRLQELRGRIVIEFVNEGLRDTGIGIRIPTVETGNPLVDWMVDLGTRMRAAEG